mmetsp:Transcript_9931/g.27148  ORF Transcript_9931/g.27148 Transcript_9931/m.27148 type:complete len:210 (+) Transcript_9931:1419-2048(+)
MNQSRLRVHVVQLNCSRDISTTSSLPRLDGQADIVHWFQHSTSISSSSELRCPFHFDVELMDQAGDEVLGRSRHELATLAVMAATSKSSERVLDDIAILGSVYLLLSCAVIWQETIPLELGWVVEEMLIMLQDRNVHHDHFTFLHFVLAATIALQLEIQHKVLHDLARYQGVLRNPDGFLQHRVCTFHLTDLVDGEYTIKWSVAGRTLG